MKMLPIGTAKVQLISQLESLVDAKAWPYPTYADILFSV